jgi:hypothetical protein
MSNPRQTPNIKQVFRQNFLDTSNFVSGELIKKQKSYDVVNFADSSSELVNTSKG